MGSGAVSSPARHLHQSQCRAQAARSPFSRGNDEEGHVLHVCPEENVERIANDRDGANCSVEEDISQHPGDQPAGRAELPGFPDEVGRNQTRNHVARHGDQADDAIETEANGGAGTNAPSIRRASASRRAIDCCLALSKGTVVPRIWVASSESEDGDGRG